MENHPNSIELPDSATKHGFVIFEDRVIFDAQPPITADQLYNVEKRIGCPVPPGLRALWDTAFGGSVGYDLEVDFHGHVDSFSFAELFYPGSDGYHDLWGWIENEFDAAADVDPAHRRPDRLSFLPFGGFGYSDRLYVCLEEQDYGAVFAWMKGLPPAWPLRLHENSLARIADDVWGLFRQLGLECDPFAESEDFNAADEMIDAVARVENDPELTEALISTIRRALLDWRGALEAGSLAGIDRLRRLALAQAATDGDLGLADRLAGQGCDLEERYAQGGNLVDHLLANEHDQQASDLIDRGFDVGNTILSAAQTLSPERTRQLLQLGAVVTSVPVLTAAISGSFESATLMADALARDQLEHLMPRLDRSIASAELSASRVQSGELMSNLKPADYREQADRIRLLRRHVEERLSHA